MNSAALLNHLWQSSAFLAAAAALAFLLRRHQARVRFWIWMAASLKFLVPFSLLAALGSRLRWPAAPVLTPAPALAAISRPFAGAATVWMDLGSAEPARASLPWLMPLLLTLAAAGSAALLARWCVQWRRLAGCARRAQPAELHGTQVRLTSEAMEPGVFGIRHPMVLLPERLQRELSDEQMASVLAHEQCHIRRHDNLWAAMHMLAEALFWFFPPVWWLGARLVAERERACDEEVLRQGGDRTAYAESLLAVCRFYLESPLRCAAGVSGGGLARRVRAIVSGGWAHNLSRGRRWVLCGLGALALAGPVAIGLLAAQSAPRFDTASIRPARPGQNGFDTHVSPGRFVMTSATVRDLIGYAYQLKDPQVVGGPAWVGTSRFDVTARAADRDTAQEQAMSPQRRAELLRLRVQSLLRERFGLRLRDSTRKLPVLALIVGSGGLKAARSPLPSGGSAGDGKAEVAMGMDGGQWVLKVVSAPLRYLVLALSGQPEARGRLLVDDTGISEPLSYTLRWSPQSSSASPDAAPSGVGPSLVTALREQLGLDLVARSEPVRVALIERAVLPSAN